ncbi:Amino acid/polyamine transporter I [Penicillium brevicompactum]|uniref:Amino acid/polyamine transporter I n=1 Tax=Penicillium brevicompactum TaxID=5074 RepID=A0A9W9R4I0_PENBR|nr:Amino acid/polyamine transporter I [Penicillium brevicompactum]KAJ5319477.1 Amino acid/polyamine transporter I [Penicillium brevicompactum]KAJ5353587.1 Amino acid/polyamine transporter I [Penicillium brevicompactum]
MSAAIQSAEHNHTDPEKPTKHKMQVSEKDEDASSAKRDSVDSGSMQSTYDHTHRKLKPRHVQLIGIGGTIGTALYVQIGSGLRTSGPASLFIGFSLWSCVILIITVCTIHPSQPFASSNSNAPTIAPVPKKETYHSLGLAEMVTYLPISSPFIRFAGRYVDEALGVAAGYNFFIFEAALVPFEVVAVSLIVRYWTNVIPVAAMNVIVLVLYGALNLFAVKWYGEAEFWLSLGKVLLSIGLIFYTFIVMLGGNPLGDRFGFRYWNEPGAFNEYYKTGDTGRWLGVLAAVITASFTIAGPDYVSMAAGETINPRRVLPRAFNGVFYRLTAFFVLGVLCVGILVPYNDQTMADAFDNDKPGAAASPYVISMDRLKIPILPDIVNAVVLTASFSAGNSYMYCASRSLYGLALEGKAPKILTKCTSRGVPIYCVCIVLVIALLSFLQVSNSAAVVLNWFVNLVTASQLINFSVVTFTFIRFKKALDAQGIPRESLPYRSWFQPYIAYVACTCTTIMAFVGGYTVFLPGNWSIPTFLFSYTMIGVFPILYFGWKFFHKTKFLKPEEVDLVSGVVEIEEYTRDFVTPPPKTVLHKFFNMIFE